jgi:hypothetical protein
MARAGVTPGTWLPHLAQNPVPASSGFPHRAQRTGIVYTFLLGTLETPRRQDERKKTKIL